MRRRLLPTGGSNKFRIIKAKKRDALARGLKLIDLSIDQPAGPALWPVRNGISLAAMSEDPKVWDYQDDDTPGLPGFAQKFVQAHVKTDLSKLPDGSVSYLPIHGIKSTLFTVSAAMGSWTDNSSSPNPVHIYSMTNPGYPSPYDQALMLKGAIPHHLPLREEDDFLFRLSDLDQAPPGSLLHLNLPHNPTGAVGKGYWLNDLCTYCSDREIWVFNDSAYSILFHTNLASTLADVATRYPNLNWAEAFSASKAGNNCGTRIAAMVGSPEFMADIVQINGNMNSGLSAVMAAGILELFEKYKHLIEEVRVEYEERLSLLIDILTKLGMRLAVQPGAGFFALFNAPKMAFGQEITSGGQFNQLMIENTGVVGVDFDQYIRYAVCVTDIEQVAVEIAKAFRVAEVSY